MNTHGLKSLFCFTGYRITDIIFSPEIVQVNLQFDRRFRPRCPVCGKRASRDHTEMRHARDLPFGPAVYCIIIYPAMRIRCRHCGKQAYLGPPQINTRCRATWRLMRHAARLAMDLPILKAAQLLGVTDTRLRRWDKAILAEHLPAPNLNSLRLLMVDEKAIGRGHDYVTVVLNGETGELLHCHEGRKKASLKAFFDTLTGDQKARIEAVCVDRLGAYVNCIEEQVPAAEIVFDKFHLVKNFQAVVDDVRREQWNLARQENDPAKAKLIKGQRYNLFRRGVKNSESQKKRLDELLAFNEPLSKVYVLKEDFCELLGSTGREAGNWLKQWLKAASESGLKAVEKFAASLERSSQQVINAIRYGLSNGRLEGFNNLISRVIHRGCGYRDEDYLFLKLRQLSLPQNQRLPHLQK